MIVIFIAAYFLKDLIFTIDNVVYKYLIIFGTSIGATILISYFSYNYFEVKFLKMKTKYSKIHSTNTTSRTEESNERISLQAVIQ
jgi:peptidoglycan/LPS O-acetylase OafA/YrhL